MADPTQFRWSFRASAGLRGLAASALADPPHGCHAERKGVLLSGFTKSGSDRGLMTRSVGHRSDVLCPNRWWPVDYP